MASANPSNEKQNEPNKDEANTPAPEKEEGFRLPDRQKRREIIKQVLDEKRAKRAHEEKRSDEPSPGE